MSISFREARAEDVPALTDLYNYYISNTAITFDIKPFSVEERVEWFSHYNRNERHRLFIAEENSRLIGFASSSPVRPKAAFITSVETTIYLLPDTTGKGIGTGLYSHLFNALEGKDVHRAYAVITLPNPESITLHEKFDFREAGTHREVGRKFGQYHDVLWMEKNLNEP